MAVTQRALLATVVLLLAALGGEARSLAQAEYDTPLAAILASPDLTLIAGAAGVVNLTDTLSSPDLVATLFLPTDAALQGALTALNLTAEQFLAPERLPFVRSVLEYHVVLGTALRTTAFRKGRFALRNTFLANTTVTVFKEGGTVTLTGRDRSNNPRIVRRNIAGGKAIIHVINQVLLPPYSSFVEAGGASPDFTSLVAAVAAADLVPTLSEFNNKWTLFAPTNAAFSKLLTALNTSLPALAQNKALLTSVLQYHIVPAPVFSFQVRFGSTYVPTLLAGEGLTVSKNRRNNKITLEDKLGQHINVIATNVRAGAGVVHVIDGVLVPLESLP